MNRVVKEVTGNQEVNQNIVEILKRERTMRNWSYEELGKRLGVSASYVYRLETGQRMNPSTKVLKAMCELFGLEPTKVMAMEPNELSLNGKNVDMAKVHEIMDLIVNMDVDKMADVFILLEKVTSVQNEIKKKPRE